MVILLELALKTPNSWKIMVLMACKASSKGLGD